MTADYVMDVTNEAIKVTLMLSLPMLAGALIIGIVVSIFQAVTQINEQTLAFIPKIVAIFFVLILMSPWLIDTMTTYTREIILSIPSMVANQ